MSCFRGISNKTRYPLKCIRKGSSKILKKILGKNSGIYSINHTFLKEEDMERSKYVPRVEMKENNNSIEAKIKKESSKGDIINQFTNETDSKIRDIRSNEKNDYISNFRRIDNKTMQSNEKDIIGSNHTNHHGINQKDNFQNSSPNTDDIATNFDNSFESIPIENGEVVVEVQLERTKSKFDSENIHDTISENLVKKPESQKMKRNNETELKFMSEMMIMNKDTVIDRENNMNLNSNITETETFGSKENFDSESHKKTASENRNENLARPISGKQEIPSPISKITPFKRHPINSYGYRTNGNSISNIVQPNDGTKTSYGKRYNLSKEYDLIEYSSINLESLMTRVDSDSEYHKNLVDTPEKQRIPSPISKEPNGPTSVLQRLENRMKSNTSEDGRVDQEKIKVGSSDGACGDSSNLYIHKKTMEPNEYQLDDNNVVPSDDDLHNNNVWNISENSLPNFDGLVETNVDTSYDTILTESKNNSVEIDEETDIDFFNNNQRNISVNSFLNLDGLVETKVDTSCNTVQTESRNTSIKIDAETEKNDIDFSSHKKYSEEPENGEIVVRNNSDTFEEIIEDAPCSPKTATNGRIPPFKMKKFETLFRKSSLKHLYKLMEKSHKTIQVRETPTDEDIMSKFVINCYGPSRTPTEKKKFFERCRE